MQKATVTFVVKSTGKEFSENTPEIVEKVIQKLVKGEYTADIEDVPAIEVHLNGQYIGEAFNFEMTAEGADELFKNLFKAGK